MDRQNSQEACPCCGYEALAKKTKCVVCLWIPDGADNDRAFSYSPNNKTNLNLARHRFLSKAKPINKQKARHFRVDESGGFIEEHDQKGRVLYRGPIPFVEYADLGNDRVAAIPMRLKDRNR